MLLHKQTQPSDYIMRKWYYRSLEGEEYRHLKLNFNFNSLPPPRTYIAELQRKVSVVVIDGVCIGHPCCGIPNCKIPLKLNWDRFCSIHTIQNNVCAINNCRNPVLSGSKVCHISTHQEAERIHNNQGQSRFQLRERLQHARIACPNNSTASTELLTNTANLDDLDSDDLVDSNGEVEFDLLPDGHAIPSSTTPSSTTSDIPALLTPRKLRAQFGRKSTHNKQLFVAPCGIIVARKTFFHSEAPMIKHTYRLPGTMPDHIFFDNNCTITKMVRHNPMFQNVGLRVDVFHFKCKHSEKDVFCQEHCNPVAYPELLGEGTQEWFFNSSVAEQTNAWLGGYLAICHEMEVERYNFFLNEMIRHRNIFTIAKLMQSGQQPGTRPYNNVF